VKMKEAEIKPGRTVSKIGIVFGIFWIVLMLNLSSQDEEMEPGVVFLLEMIILPGGLLALSDLR
jgi:hypothetical protein